jgi:DNA-binding CsgD family transcriptional regulator
VALQTFVDQVRTCLGIEAAQLLLRDAERTDLTVLSSSGLPPGVENAARLGQPYASQVAEQGSGVELPDIKRAANLEGREWLSAHGLSAYLAVPVESKGQVHAVLQLFSRRAMEPNPQALQFLEALTALAAQALENQRLLEQLRVAAPAGSLRPARPSGVPLNQSQIAILRLLIEGRSNRQIASAVHLGPDSVKFHTREIFRKLGVRNRVQAAVIAVRRELV